MFRRASVCLALCAALAPLCAAAIPTHAFTISTGEKRGSQYLVARKGVLTVEAPPKEIDWDRKARPGRWLVEATQIKDTVTGDCLTYDPMGKDPKVFLARKPVKGAEWDVKVLDGRNGEGKRVVIRAARGPMRGWYLAAEIVEEQRDGKTVRNYRPALVKDANLKLMAERIYEHR